MWKLLLEKPWVGNNFEYIEYLSVQLGTGKFLCLIIVTLLAIFLFLFHHVEGYLNNLTIYFHFFRIGLSFLTTNTISFLHFLPFINTLQKNLLNLFISLNFFPVEIEDLSTDD